MKAEILNCITILTKKEFKFFLSIWNYVLHEVCIARRVIDGCWKGVSG